MPAEQLSVWVQAFPSLHALPFGRGRWRTPRSGSQLSSVQGFLSSITGFESHTVAERQLIEQVRLRRRARHVQHDPKLEIGVVVVQLRLQGRTTA